MSIELDERQLRLTLESAPLALLAHDETGRVRFISREFLRLSGYRAEDIPTFADWLDLAYGDPEITKRVLAAHSEGYSDTPRSLPHGGEYRVRVADGSTRIWRFRAFSIGRDEAGLGVNVSMALDMTTEREAIDALARSEATLRQALRIGGVGSFERDLIASVSTYSDELMAIHGLPEARRRESDAQWLERVHLDDRDRVAAYAAAAMSPDPPTVIEYRVTRISDGAVRRIAEQAQVQRDPAGRPFRSLGLQRDVTEARAADQALRESEARLRLSLELAEVGVFDWDLVNNSLTWDDRVREIWGFDPGEPVTIEKFFHGVHIGDVDRLRAVVSASHDPGGDGGYDVEYRVISRKDELVRHVSARGRTLFENGRPARMMGVVVDVTALREAAALLKHDRDELEARVEARTSELAEAQTRLAQAQRLEALGQLAGGIAHDFNNVLQAVEAASDLVERKPDPQNLPRYLKMAREATKRGSAISRRLLSFSRRSELEPESVETPLLVRDIGDILRRTMGEGVTVELDCPADCPPALCDRRMLETALLNIAANASEAMEGHGTLRFVAGPQSRTEAEACAYRARLKPGEYVRFEIGDTGRGMDEEVRARAVEPFFSTKPRGQGAGLGLSMVRGFAEQSGGCLSLRSEPGKGSTIALWLPVAAPASDMIAIPTPPDPAGERGRLLFVDDDPLVRELVGEQLRMAGYNVTVCGNGGAAIDRLDSGLAIDALVTDFSMPEMNGVTLAHEARKRRPRLPVLLLTGYSAEAAEAAGDADYALIRKPIDGKALASRVAAMIEAS